VDIDSFDPWIRPSDAFWSLGRALSYFGLGLVSPPSSIDLRGTYASSNKSETSET